MATPPENPSCVQTVQVVGHRTRNGVQIQTYVAQGCWNVTVNSTAAGTLQKASYVTAPADVSIDKVVFDVWPSITGTNENPDGIAEFDRVSITAAPVTAGSGKDGIAIDMAFRFRTDVAASAQILVFYYVVRLEAKL